MKIIKYFLITIFAVIAALLIAGLFIPKEVHVERSIVINAPHNVIHEQVSSLQKINEWSPWKDYDAEMKVRYEGEDGEVGSVSHWEGNKDVGKGSQEITSITEDRIETKVHFLEPWESKMIATYTLEKKEEGIKVTWGSDGESPYPFNVFSLFMDMDEMIGKDFEKGLARLKEISERMPEVPKSYSGYMINEMEMNPRIYLAKKGNVPFDKIEGFYQENLPAIFQTINKAGIKASGAPSGLFYKWNDQEKIAEMAAAIPVDEHEKLSGIKNFERINVAGGKALHISYYGSYNKSERAHFAMDEYMREKGLQLRGEVIEEYITDPTTEPDTSKWLTNIYYLVK